MGNWRDAIIRPHDTILAAIESIERGVRQIALVLDDDERLIGSVTDGDIRRAILKGMTLEQPVVHAMNSAPFRVDRDHDKSALKATMLARRLHQVPVTDSDGHVIDLIIIDDLVKSGQARENWVVLMAGGLGRRLHPLTENTPKPLIEVGGKPLLEGIVENFVSQGFSRFYISINYKGDQIRNHFGDGGKWNSEIRYLSENIPMGTAGALSLIDPPPETPLIVMNGDLLTEIDFNRALEFHDEQGATGTMGVRSYDFQVDFGVVDIDNGRISAINEKPVHKFFVNAGIYVLDPSALADIPRDTATDMPALFESWMAAGKNCAAFPIHEYWLDVGRIEDLERAREQKKP
ncbi:nucleotidyltransferase family protein [bacterium SCSIO 12827]|nr:nucleotidyltransferase family protein [bacterium SCSIO 12827]